MLGIIVLMVGFWKSSIRLTYIRNLVTIKERAIGMMSRLVRWVILTRLHPGIKLGTAIPFSAMNLNS